MFSITSVRLILNSSSTAVVAKMHFYGYLLNCRGENVIHNNMRRQFECKLCSHTDFWRQSTGGELGKSASASHGFSSVWLVGGHLLTARARAGDSGFSSSRAGSGRLLMLKLFLMEAIRIWQKRGEQYYAKKHVVMAPDATFLRAKDANLDQQLASWATCAM